MTESLAAAGLRLAATLSRMPVAAIVTSSDEPPNDTNGSGTPVTGRMPITAPMLMNAWTDDPGGDARGEQRAEAVGRPQRGPHAEHREGDEQADDEQRADQAELLTDDGEDEVGVGVGQEAPLGPAGAQADAGTPPSRGRPSDWMVW